MNLEEFSIGFIQEVVEESIRRSEPTEMAFVEKMCSYLSDNGVLPEIESSFYQKQAKGIKVNGYCYHEESKRLSLCVASFDMEKARGTISQSNAERLARRALKFFEESSIGLKKEINEFEKAYALADLIENIYTEVSQLDIYLLTNLNYKSNDLITISTQFPDVRVYVWDIERLYQLVDESQGMKKIEINFEQDLGETFQLMMVPDQSSSNVYDCYVGYISGEILARAYEVWGQRLVERNVRSFLQARGGVNKGIKKTLQNESYMFMAYNNGISTVAEEVSLVPVKEGLNLYKVVTVKGWQIVNGGQTTASLYQAWKDRNKLDDVSVQIKMSVIKQEEKFDEMISAISQCANTQNRISLSDLQANHPIHIDLENLSRTIWVPDPQGRKSQTKWFYERAKGQYLVELNRQSTVSRKKAFKEQNPKSQVITKTQLAKYIMSWEQKPYTVSKGGEATFKEYMDLSTKESISIDANYYKMLVAKSILFNSCDDIVKNRNFGGYKANVVTYSISMLSHLVDREMDFLSIWALQEIDSEKKRKMKIIADFTWRHITNPPIKGTNITQWCKRKECWDSYKDNYSEELKKIIQQRKPIH
ncbi:hypothetical protein J2Z48_001261 [Croceifilum oryzae]|uniref:AIPR protein n=1 Tax=Croceifilum oryzae TaxID=1553429 RepID=A0AAJ1TEP4_9BACL|nr:AIPR family protein [Croceifilum oryzae]MDQ0417089.1 hypothetical protein [Croceifilum oryzae]